MPPESALHPDLTAGFKLAMRRLAATVTIVTAGREGWRFGMAATAVTSVTTAPPTLLICINRAATIHDIIVETGQYCVNVLGTHHAGLVGPFGGGAEGEARFGHGAWSHRDGGMPSLDDAQASLFCAVRQTVEYGSHSVLIGEVTSVHLSDAVAPLLYQDGGLAMTRPARLTSGQDLKVVRGRRARGATIVRASQRACASREPRHRKHRGCPRRHGCPARGRA